MLGVNVHNRLEWSFGLTAEAKRTPSSASRGRLYREHPGFRVYSRERERERERERDLGLDSLRKLRRVCQGRGVGLRRVGSELRVHVY